MTEQAQVVKTPKKPRSDKGKPRGSYKARAKKAEPVQANG